MKRGSEGHARVLPCHIRKKFRSQTSDNMDMKKPRWEESEKGKKTSKAENKSRCAER
jgi:hypothetical protein